MAELSHIPNHLLERHLAELTDPAGRERIDSHLLGCAGCRAKLAEAQHSRDAFLARNPPQIRARQLLQLQPAVRRRRWWVHWLSSVAMAAATAVVVFTWVDSSIEDDGHAVLSKGGDLVTLQADL